MIKPTNLALGAALLAVAGSAYADESQTNPAAAPQMSAVPKMEPKSGGASNTESTHYGIPAGYDTKQWDMRPAPGGQNTESTHFVKPPGYDQNPWMHPYASGEKPS